MRVLGFRATPQALIFINSGSDIGSDSEEARDHKSTGKWVLLIRV